MTAVRCVDICKTYRQGDEDIKALDHLSIDIEAGGFVCLSSPSGVVTPDGATTRRSPRPRRSPSLP